MLTIRLLTTGDLPQALQLSTDAGWNQTLADWRRFLNLAPDGCFVACVDECPVGTVTTCQFGEVGWIGMMLVNDKWRRQGIGRALFQQAVEHLEITGARTIRLDATPAGIPLYAAWGFREQFLLHRYAGTALPAEFAAGAGGYRGESDRESLASMDVRVIGYNRLRLLDVLRQEPHHRCVVVRDGSTVIAYGMSRPGLRAVFLGPCIADREEAGCRLLGTLLRDHQGQQVFVDIPQDNQAAVATAIQAGLSPARPLLRMTRGQPRREMLNGLFASSGPEKG